MKILLVNDYGAPYGGAEVQVWALRDGLRARGHDARLFSSSARPAGGSSFADYECLGTTSRFRTLLQAANPWAFWRLRRVLAEFRPDVVHVRVFLTQLSPLILPLLRDVPSLHQVVSYRPICPTGTRMLRDGTPCDAPAGSACHRNGCLPLRDWPPLMLQLKLYRRWRHAFDQVLANSQAVRLRLAAGGIAPDAVIWNGVRFRPPRPPLAAPPTAAFAGRLVPEKGADVLLRAFARTAEQIPQARLLVAGDGLERERLHRLKDELGLSGSVAMPGHLSRAKIERRFDAAWTQVVPSRWEEPFGNAALEGMMRGTAVIASRAGGLAEFVRDDRTGLLVPPGDPEALAGALVRLLRDRELAEEMGRQGRELALEQFSEAGCVDRLLQIYRTLCGIEGEGETGRGTAPGMVS
jgi:glycosyltransferase involved in cell wall biosynthesis